MLGYVHGRLRQIKQCPDYSPFGNVSVIAVGDFYQLPPVKGKPLNSPPDNGVDLWTDVFEIVELQEIMRQKGGEFAAILNRLRTKKKEDILTDTDDPSMKARVTGETSTSALGIYSTNKQVDDVNTAMLTENCTNIVEIAAHDLTKDPRTGRLIKKVNYYISNKSLSLAKSLLLAINARVMLTKNINVSDGLVNGVLGTVSHISFGDNQECTTVYVIFDDKKISKELLHKVQGVTTQNAVVSLKKILSPGQAYVALIRVTSIEGLVIEDYSPKAIFCNKLIKPSIENMTQFIQTENDLCNECILTMALHNTEGLPAHYNDIANDERLSGIDYICVTETWLTDDHNSVDIQGYDFHHQTRSMSYDVDHELQTQIHGGVGIFAKITSEYDQIPLQTKNIE
ncbi:ATP-dependent DNA helicase PIF1-like [Tubulanus polymorphus]|uniref:ATP-dependent DNA helicase PIF1-like n=1 Tax=Tubulanus polymorphus TaxID=672921 RepID=UPI003DA5ACFC